MSLFLAIDTATDTGSVAVGSPGHPQAETTFTERRHASVVMPAVEETLRIAGVTMSDLSGIVIADGPGSFTGLRIGLATVKGILTVHDTLEVFCAPSLAAAAWHTMQFVAGPVAVLYDAYRGEVFGAVYDRDGAAITEVVPPTCCSVSDFVALVQRPPVLAVGDGAALYAEEVRDWIGRDPVGPPAGAPRASTLLELMLVDGGTSRVQDPETFEPTYGRQAAAQDRWEEAHGRRLPDSSSDRS